MSKNENGDYGVNKMKLVPLYNEIDICKFEGDSIMWCRPEWVDDAMHDGTLRYDESDNILYKKITCVGEIPQALKAGNYIANVDDVIYFMTEKEFKKLLEYYKVKPQE